MQKEFGFGKSVVSADGTVDEEAQKKFDEHQEEIMKAFQSGVRVNRTGSVEHNLKLQGNAEMLSLQAVQQRDKIKHDQRLTTTKSDKTQPTAQEAHIIKKPIVLKKVI